VAHRPISDDQLVTVFLNQFAALNQRQQHHDIVPCLGDYLGGVFDLVVGVGIHIRQS
jgi:hypothetical protein